MPVFVAFLRGINVGGSKLLSMANLKAIFADDLEFKDVRTLLQSGNVVFSASGTPASHAKKIADAIRRRFKVDVRVMVRTPAQLRTILERNPFASAARDDPSHLLIVFLAAKPSVAAAKAIAAANFEHERFHLAGTELFAHYAAGIGKSKVPANFIEKTLAVPGTARNWNTVTKLIALAAEIARRP